MKKGIAALFVLGLLVFSLSVTAEELEEQEEATETGVTMSVDKDKVVPGETVKLTLDPNGATEWKVKVIIPKGWQHAGGGNVLTLETESGTTEYELIAPSKERTYRFQGRWWADGDRGQLNRVEVEVSDDAASVQEEESGGEGTEEEETEEEETEEETGPARPVHYNHKWFDLGDLFVFNINFTDVKVQLRHRYRSFREKVSGMTFFRARGDDIDCRLNRFRLQSGELNAETGPNMQGTAMLTCTIPVNVTVTEDEVVGTYMDDDTSVEVFKLTTGDDEADSLEEETGEEEQEEESEEEESEEEEEESEEEQEEEP
jgi:hypothetical protein